MNGKMKKVLLINIFFALLSNVFSQSLIFEEYFEGGIIPPTWTTIDKDADTHTWFGETWKNLNGITEGYVASESWNSNTGALTPENYLITPNIDLNGLQGSVKLCYSIQVLDAEFPAEHYKIAVSTTGKSAADFTNIIKDETCTSADYFFTNPFWHKRNVDLTPFVGQMIYLTFIHNNLIDMYKLLLDSVQISYSTNVGYTKLPDEINIVTFPNPAKSNLEVTGMFENAKIQLISAEGREVYRSDDVTNQKTINVSDLQNGVYLLRLESKKGILTRKIRVFH